MKTRSGVAQISFRRDLVHWRTFADKLIKASRKEAQEPFETTPLYRFGASGLFLFFLFNFGCLRQFLAVPVPVHESEFEPGDRFSVHLEDFLTVFAGSVPLTYRQNQHSDHFKNFRILMKVTEIMISRKIYFLSAASTPSRPQFSKKLPKTAQNS